MNPTSIDFGGVVVSSSGTQAITLTNTGGSVVVVSQATVSGAGFSTSGLSLPVAISPGQSSSFNVQFAPASPGASAGSLSVVSDATNSPAAVLLSGNGLAPVLQLSVNPTNIDFGDVAVGGASTQSVLMTNAGNANLTVTAANVTGAGFSITPPLTLPLTLTPGQTSSFTARFAPTATGAVAGSISLVSNATNSPTAVSLAGNGVPPLVGTLTTNPTSINFGDVIVGNNSTQAVVLTNTGTANLTVTAANVTGAGFSITPPLVLPLTLTPGQTSNFTVRFAPTGAGVVPGSVSLVSNASNSPTAISLAGNGVAQVLQLTLNPTSIDFGDVVVGSTDSRLVTVTNTGNSNVTITSAPITGAGISASGLALPLPLTPNQSASFSVNFAPGVPGAVAGSVSLLSNAPTALVTLAGNGVAAGLLNVNPSNLNFGSIIVGNSDTRTITLTNTGGLPVDVLSAAPTGTGFSISGFVAQTLAAGANMSFTAQFTPAASGPAAGNITINSTAANTPNVVTLAGTGVAQVLTVSLSPSSINFGDVTVGGGSANQTVTMTNTGNFNVNVTAATAIGAGFSVVGFVAQTPLAPGQSSTFTARFAPTVTGAAAGNISLTSTATNNPTVSLSGNGIATPVGTLTTNPTSINFGSIIVGNTSSQSVTLTNTGTANLTITAANVTGAGFSITPPLTLPLTLIPGQTGSFTARFAPASAGAVAGSVSLVSNASNTPTSVTLSGTGVAQILTVSLSPSTINFGDVTVGNTSNQTVTMTNTGNFNVNVTAAAATGAGFSVVGFVAQTPLAPGQTSTFTARFAPAVAGAVAGTISLTSTATNNPTVSLAGNGVVPAPAQLAINPVGIDFGGVVVGSSLTRSVTLTNVGSGVLTISQANVTGAVFSISGLTLPLTLNAGQNTTFSARFAPTSAGIATGSVSFVSDASNSPTTLSLTGAGTVGVSLSWDASTSVVVGYNVYRSLTIGGPYARLNVSVIPGLNYTDSTALPGNTYYYVATAVDADGVESILSNELKVILP